MTWQPATNERQMLDREQVDSILLDLHNGRRLAKRLIDSRKRHVQTVARETEKVRTKVRMLRTQLINIINRAETELLEEVNFLEKIEHDESEAEIQRCEHIRATVTKRVNALQVYTSGDVDTEKSFSVQFTQEELERYANLLSQMSGRSKIANVHFNVATVIETVMDAANIIGTISVTRLPQSVYGGKIADQSYDNENRQFHNEMREFAQRIDGRHLTSALYNGVNGEATLHREGHSYQEGSHSLGNVRNWSPRNERTQSSTWPMEKHNDTRLASRLSPRDVMPPRTETTNERSHFIRPLRALLVSTITYRQRPSYDKCCSLTGAMFLRDGRVIVVDFNNQSLQMYGDKHGLLCERKFPSTRRYDDIADVPVMLCDPRDVTAVSDSEIAVTARDGVHIFAANSDTLEHKKHYVLSSVTDTINGITVQKGEFVIACGFPACVKVVPMSKQIYCRTRNIDARAKFTNPAYVIGERDSEHVYVTDADENSVTCLNSTDGRVVWTFTHPDLRKPQGIAVNGDKLFVASWAVHKILQLTTSGQLVATIVSGIGYPQKIAINSAGNRMLVTSSHEGYLLTESQQRNIHIFSLV